MNKQMPSLYQSILLNSSWRVGHKVSIRVVGTLQQYVTLQESCGEAPKGQHIRLIEINKALLSMIIAMIEGHIPTNTLGRWLQPTAGQFA